MEHIFWNCTKARACWTKLLSHWTGACETPERVACRLANCANRRAPSIPQAMKDQLLRRFQDDVVAGETGWTRVCFLLSSMCLTHLWTERNDAVFRGLHTTSSQSVHRFWSGGIRQLTALALREHRSAATFIQGAQLHACIEILLLEPKRSAVVDTVSHVTTPEPVLISWLQSFQSSCA